MAFISNQQAINPITNTSWEHVGVTPDITVPAAQAQQVAHAAILRDLAIKAANPEAKARLEATLVEVEAKAAGQ